MRNFVLNQFKLDSETHKNLENERSQISSDFSSAKESLKLYETQWHLILNNFKLKSEIESLKVIHERKKHARR